ncbi:transposase [Endozoicomonas sp. 4G]|uniref:transposase n=1 Tax=Endozoicomonas sp. 4G TaxID=2872754 RepID=UPI003209786B
MLVWLQISVKYEVCMYERKSCKSCVFRNNVHLVFGTKYRRNVFTKEMIDRLRSDCHSKANALQGLDPPLKKRDCALNFVQTGSGVAIECKNSID